MADYNDLLNNNLLEIDDPDQGLNYNSTVLQRIIENLIDKKIEGFSPWDHHYLLENVYFKMFIFHLQQLKKLDKDYARNLAEADIGMIHVLLHGKSLSEIMEYRDI